MAKLRLHFSTKMYAAVLECTQNSLNLIKARISSRPTTTIVGKPFFDVGVELQLPDVLMNPPLTDIQGALNRTSRAVLMERRTGALMGDVSMDDYGCVAISPLWLGGTAHQQSLYVVHDADGLAGASAVRDGLWLGGWAAAKPKVSDSSLAEGRFKFFLGSTKWERGGLQAELDDGAWLALDVAPALVIKDRVGEQRPGAPKPMWTELMRLVGAEVKGLVEMVYPEE